MYSYAREGAAGADPLAGGVTAAPVVSGAHAATS